MVKRMIKAFKEATSRTRYFFLGILVLTLVIVGTTGYAYLRVLLENLSK
jgi:hypothetical protein